MIRRNREPASRFQNFRDVPDLRLPVPLKMGSLRSVPVKISDPEILFPHLRFSRFPLLSDKAPLDSGKSVKASALHHILRLKIQTGFCLPRSCRFLPGSVFLRSRCIRTRRYHPAPVHMPSRFLNRCPCTPHGFPRSVQIPQRQDFFLSSCFPISGRKIHTSFRLPSLYPAPVPKNCRIPPVPEKLPSSRQCLIHPTPVPKRNLLSRHIRYGSTEGIRHKGVPLPPNKT